MCFGDWSRHGLLDNDEMVEVIQAKAGKGKGKVVADTDPLVDEEMFLLDD